MPRFASLVEMKAGITYAETAVTANTTLTAGHSIVAASAASASITITLPTAASVAGRSYIIVRTDSTTANTVTVATTASQTINGVATYTRLWDQYTYLEVTSDGSNWLIVGEHGIPEPWQSATLASGQWSQRGTGYPTLRYRRLPGGDQVQWVGDVTFTGNGTTGLTSGASVTTAVPSAYRPTNEQHVWSSIAGGTGTPAITANRVPLGVVDSTGVLKTYNVTSNATNLQTAILQFNGILSLAA